MDIKSYVIIVRNDRHFIKKYEVRECEYDECVDVGMLVADMETLKVTEYVASFDKIEDACFCVELQSAREKNKTGMSACKDSAKCEQEKKLDILIGMLQKLKEI